MIYILIPYKCIIILLCMLSFKALSNYFQYHFTVEYAIQLAMA
jgi:hypothetical protein